MKVRACGECEKGTMQETLIDHVVERQDRPSITVPKVKVNQCTECRRVTFPRTSSQFIENFIREEDDTISSKEMEDFRNSTGCTQDELSEILGLGDKTFHRWEKGSHYPSRSMGYYIRILAEYPHAFDWLKNRAWRNKSFRERSPRLSHQLTRNDTNLDAHFASQEEYDQEYSVFSTLNSDEKDRIGKSKKFNLENVWN